MSWRGFKKGFNRAGTVIKQKTGIAEKTIDTVFEQEESNLKRNKGQVETMLEDTQEYLEALRAIMICQTIIAFHSGDDAAVDKCRKLEDYFCSEYDLIYQQVITMPLDRTLAQIEALEESMKKRAKKLLDYDDARSKVNKSSQKAIDNAKLAKLKEQEAQARIAYESLHSEILNSIPRLNQARQAILNETLVRFKDINNRFASDMSKYASQVGNSSSFNGYSNSKQKIRENLDAIKNLSIATK